MNFRATQNGFSFPDILVATVNLHAKTIHYFSVKLKIGEISYWEQILSLLPHEPKKWYSLISYF